MKISRIKLVPPLSELPCPRACERYTIHACFPGRYYRTTISLAGRRRSWKSCFLWQVHVIIGVILSYMYFVAFRLNASKESFRLVASVTISPLALLYPRPLTDLELCPLLSVGISRLLRVVHLSASSNSADIHMKSLELWSVRSFRCIPPKIWCEDAFHTYIIVLQMTHGVVRLSVALKEWCVR